MGSVGERTKSTTTRQSTLLTTIYGDLTICLSPDEMTNTELEKLITEYKKYAETDSYGPEYYMERATELQTILDKRAADGTSDVVPETTPRHLNSTTV